MTAAVGMAVLAVEAQTPDLSGHWLRKQLEHVSGKPYANGLATKMQFAVGADSLLLEREYEGPSGVYTIKEALALDGKPETTDRSNGVQRTARFIRGAGTGSFSVEVRYRDKQGKQAGSDFTEHWTLAPDGSLLVEKNATDADGSTWTMTGSYTKKTAEQIAYETATGQGVRFAEGLSWEQAKAKARSEQKYIFVDAYATWCAPCKEMDRSVFPLNRVGDALNTHFIPLKVQMDSTGNDNAEVKSWYRTAKAMMKDYAITGFPTYLFFNPQGELVHRGIGSYSPDDFLTLVAEARDPDKQYQRVVARYKNGERDYARMDSLILLTKQIGDTELLNAMLEDYRDNYLEKLPVDSLLNARKLGFINRLAAPQLYQRGTDGIFFKALYAHGDKADALTDIPGFAKFHVTRMVNNEVINSKLYKDNQVINTSPDWAAMEAELKSRFPALDADLMLLDAKYLYAHMTEDWQRKIDYFVQKIDKYGIFIEPEFPDNKIIRTLVPYCNDPKVLEKALGWMAQVVESDIYGPYAVAQAYGNYAALLYFAGRRGEALQVMEQHMEAKGYTPDKKDTDFFRDKVAVWEKMKRGEKMDGSWKISAFS